MSYSKTRRALSEGSQVRQMQLLWPEFDYQLRQNGWHDWRGPLKPISRTYIVDVLWHHVEASQPYVVLSDPALRPREGGDFSEIPHLYPNESCPERSPLCLFDPEGGEWKAGQAIARTTIPWASEWLMYYELWLVDGVWRGAGVGLESVAEMRRAGVY